MSSCICGGLAFGAQAGSSVVVHMTRVSSLRLRWQSLANASGMLAVLLATVFTPFVASLNLYLQDWLLRITTHAALPEEFALVTIDERSLSLSEVNPEEIAESPALQLMHAGFPWSREVYAALTEKLMAAGARLVIFDVLFPTAKEGDQPFADALKTYPGRWFWLPPSKTRTLRIAAPRHLSWWFLTMPFVKRSMVIGVSSTCRCGGTIRCVRYSPPQAPQTSWAFRPFP